MIQRENLKIEAGPMGWVKALQWNEQEQNNGYIMTCYNVMFE